MKFRKSFQTLKERHRLNELEMDLMLFVPSLTCSTQTCNHWHMTKPGGTLFFQFHLYQPHGHDVHRFTTTGVANLAKHADLQVISNEAMGNSECK